MAMTTADAFTSVNLPEQKLWPTATGAMAFPAVLAANPSVQLGFEEFKEAIKAKKAWIEEVLQASGAVLFRGFPVTDAAELDELLEAFGYEEYPYVGGVASRTKVVGRVYTANDSPPEKNIPFHHELSHVPVPPTKLFFFCEEEPKSRGETPIIPSNLVYEKILQRYPDFVAKLEREGLIYTHYLEEEDNYSSSPAGRGWQSTFATTDKATAEAKASQLGMKLEWLEKGGRIKFGPVPAFRSDKITGNKTWFNGLIISYVWKHDGSLPLNSVTFGDGEELPKDIIDDCLVMLEQECVAIPWKKGDILLLDNLAILHSRSPFDPPRRILASFAR